MFGNRLTKGLYAGTTREAPGLFELWNGQTREPQTTPVPVPVMFVNVAWYNNQGDFMGQGDLAGDDVRRIAKNLREGEIFVVVLRNRLIGLPDAEHLPHAKLVEVMEMIIRPSTLWMFARVESRSVRMDDVTLNSVLREWASQNLLDD